MPSRNLRTNNFPQRRATTLLRKAAAATLLISTALALTACRHESGPYVSLDRYTYISRPWSPKTVTLINPSTGESIWSVDVPVGQELRMDFSDGTGTGDLTPDRLLWRLKQVDGGFGTRRSAVSVPPSTSRLIVMTLRPAPEAPGDTFASPNPSLAKGASATSNPTQGAAPDTTDAYLQNQQILVDQQGVQQPSTEGAPDKVEHDLNDDWLP